MRRAGVYVCAASGSSGDAGGDGAGGVVLSDGAMEFHVPAPKQGLLVAWFAEDGAKVDASRPIARIVCEGAEVAVPGAVPHELG